MRWVAERVFIEGCPGFSDDRAYRAMDFLLSAPEEIASGIFWPAAHLLNLDAGIVFAGTTSTYWEMDAAAELAEIAGEDGEDEEQLPEEEGARRFGHSKDHRDDLPQVVTAMAVTRDGIPVRCWTFPARPGIGAFDQAFQVGDQPFADQLVPLGLLRVVADGESPGSFAGVLAGHPGLLDPQVPGHGVVLALAGQRRGGLRVGAAELLGVDAVTAAPGEAGAVRRGGEPAAGDPHQAAQVPRAQVILHRADDLLIGSGADELVGSLRDKPGLRRFLRRTKAGLLRIDKAAIGREARLDGKWLLRTNDQTLTPADLAAAYKQLIAVECGWKDMKGALALRLVFRYREDRSAPTSSCAGSPSC